MRTFHHGGKHTVTGSCHEVQFEHGSLLIDCGQFQGKDARPMDVEFSIEQVRALVLTHAHIDHVGRLPWLLAAGFSGPIYCTPATAELVPLMLDDGLKLQLGMDKPQRQRVLEALNKRFVPIEYGVWQGVVLSPPDSQGGDVLSCCCETVEIRFNPAGHILGSAYVEIRQENGEVIVFSGDLGPSDTPLLPDPVAPPRADVLYIESTYGNKQHDSVAHRAERLEAIINRSLQDGGVIIIPAFSVGRTQELLFDIEQLIHQRGITARIPIILDSPMASEVTRSYRRYRELWGKEAKQRLEYHRHPLAFDQCVVVEHYREHLALVNRLAKTGEPAIVVAASGMCEGGRVMGYLKALLTDVRTDVLFAGYQAQGTLGCALQSGAKRVEIADEWINVRAQIHTMSGYSAHADQTDLLRFIQGIDVPPKEIHLIHGEAEAKTAFKDCLQKLGYHVIE